MKTLFTIDKDCKVADTPSDTGFDIRPLLEHFGPDVTWKQVFKTDREVLYGIKGYGRETVNKIFVFMSENLHFSFTDMMD